MLENDTFIVSVLTSVAKRLLFHTRPSNFLFVQLPDLSKVVLVVVVRNVVLGV